MPERILLIGADEPGLLGVARHLRAHPDATATVLYPEFNPLPEFSCTTLERFMCHGIEFPETIRACGVDTTARTVMVRDTVTGRETSLDYDTLVFATGAAPATLDVPGEFLGNIHRVGGHADADRLRGRDGVNVVIGSGMNLLLAVSSLMARSHGTIEIIPHGDPDRCAPVSDALAAMIRHHLAENGVTIHDRDTLTRIEGRHRATRVITSGRTIEAARVINAMPGEPVTYLAADAGIGLGPHGHVLTSTRLETSADGVYACGGCAAFISPHCKRPIPGGAITSTINAQAIALAAALGGTPPDFRAPARAWSVALGGLTAAGAGLTPDAARECGFSPLSALAIQFDRAHFMPDASLMTLELTFDSRDGRVLGIQGLGRSGDALAGRVSAVSALLAAGHMPGNPAGHPTVHDVANLEIAYSPPFASAMDVLNTVGNVAANMLDGTGRGITAQEFDRIWRERESGGDLFIDCRELGNAAPYIERHPEHWHHIPQGEIGRRMAEIPEDGRVVLICNTGVRAYEAQLTLRHAGRNAVTVEGGMVAIGQSGIKV
jgi:NADPH-dependent 2,4-dienoyl-CoA reductase/sulfur reductase-like enzyme/rhodanese-related sulfurtransferase